MNGRSLTLMGMALREQARRPLLLILLVALPFFFITRAVAATQPTPRRLGLPGGGTVLTTMREAHGASMATITIAFIAGLAGAFVMRSAQEADRRLVVAGFRAIDAIVPRLLVLLIATMTTLTVSMAVTSLSFAAADWPVFVAGNLLVGLTYACIGALAGAALGPLGATYIVLFVAMLGTGILQNPMFGDGTPGGLAFAFPDYAANRVVIDGAFSGGSHAWGQVGLALAWLGALAAAVAAVLRGCLRPRR